MTEMEKLLAVLELPEEKQRQEIGNYFGKNYHCAKRDQWVNGDWTVIPCSKCGKQWKTWTERQKDKSRCYHSHPYKGSLADLAFRLRDEAVKNFEEWRKAVVDVACYSLSVDWENYWDYAEAIIWFVRYAQPIHWIIASLIAKQLAKKQ